MKKRGARLGQHFLIQPAFAARLAAAAHIRKGDTVLEIGPGKGALTKELLRAGERVVAIEKDPQLTHHLKTVFSRECSRGVLEILAMDVRDFVPPPHAYVVAANIPYYITGEIIRQFLTAENQPHAMALLIQKEVAERILARDGKESMLSLSVKAYGTPTIIAKVGKGNFSPPPSVDSAILAIDAISKKFFDTISEEQFFRLVRAGFASKRKMLAGNLSRMFDKAKVVDAFRTCGLYEKARAEDLDLAQWKRVDRELMR